MVLGDTSSNDKSCVSGFEGPPSGGPGGFLGLSASVLVSKVVIGDKVLCLYCIVVLPPVAPSTIPCSANHCVTSSVLSTVTVFGMVLILFGLVPPQA